MNAQEAIEQIEWLIEQHKQMQMYFADKTDAKQVGRYESLEKDVEALSIVLESAKLLHSGEPEEGPHYYYFDGWHVRKDVLPKIGVYPEGAKE